MRLALIIIATFAVGLVPALGGAATSSPGSADIAKAQRLSVRWGRCPTARPAWTVLALRQADPPSRPSGAPCPLGRPRLDHGRDGLLPAGGSADGHRPLRAGSNQASTASSTPAP